MKKLRRCAWCDHVESAHMGRLKKCQKCQCNGFAARAAKREPAKEGQ